MATLAELTTPLTRAEVEEAIYTAIFNRGVETTSWKPGAIARAIITAVAAVLAVFSALVAAIASGGFLLLAAGDWLEVKARHDYGVEKITGTFAAGDVLLTNSGGGVYNVAIGDLVVRHETSGKTYRNTAAFTLNASSTATVPVQAIELGSDSSAVPDTITEFETPLAGVTVTNPAALVGLDQESDTQLQDRCLAKLGELSENGPSDAYASIALSATTTNGEPAGVTRVTTVPDGAGGVDVYVATATGAVTGTVGDPSTPLGAVDEAIQTQVVPLAVTATVQSATALTIAVTYEVWVRASIGLTESEVQTLIENAITAFLASQPVGGSRKVAGGGFVFLEALGAAITDAVGTAYLIDLAVAAPASDTAVSATQAPVAGTLTSTVNLVSI